MSHERVETLIVGGGQAGLALSEHLHKLGCQHLILERGRIAERWRSERWDSLVANGPAWHDRFASKQFVDIDPDNFAPASMIVSYLEEHAQEIEAPVRCGTEVTNLRRTHDGSGFLALTATGVIEARNVVVATGPFQRSAIPSLVPESQGLLQIHSAHYRNPAQLPPGAVLVVGAGSSGVQIADELNRAARSVYLSVGPHERPPRRYRGRDFARFLGPLGLWEKQRTDAKAEHVTIAVSGANGGQLIDFRRLAHEGITLLGMTQSFESGVLRFAPDLADNIGAGDRTYLSMLDAVDTYIDQNGLDLPPDPSARVLPPDPQCVISPITALRLAEAGITSIIWATGYGFEFGWLEVDVFDKKGPPHP